LKGKDKLIEADCFVGKSYKDFGVGFFYFDKGKSFPAKNEKNLLRLFTSL